MIVRPKAVPYTDVLAVVTYLVLGMLVMAGYLTDPDGRISGQLPGDNTWFEWLLSHGAYSVRHLANPLFSLRQNVPFGVNMMANTSVLGVTLPLAPLTMLFGAKVTYVVWLVGACAGTAVTTYWALSRHLVRSRAAAFIGGALAGFAPGVVHHANGQPNFVSNFVLPVIVVTVFRLGATGRWVRDGVILATLVTWQLFINEELLLVTAAACGVAVIVYACQRSAEFRKRRRKFGAALGVAAAVAFALCAYPLWMQFFGPQGYQALPQFHSWGEDLATYVTMPRDTIGGVDDAGATVGRIEQNTWFGWPLTSAVLALTVALWRRSAAARTAGIVALVFAIASLGPRIRLDGRVTAVPGPWALIPDRTPVLAMLMPSRLSFAVIGACVVLLAVGWDRLAELDRPDGGRRLNASALGRMLLSAALIPLIPTPVPTIADQRPPEFITSGAWRNHLKPGTTLVPIPLPDNAQGRITLAWSTAAQQEFPIPRGDFLGPDEHGNATLGSAAHSVTLDLFAVAARTGTIPAVTVDTRTAIYAELQQWNASIVVLRSEPDHPVLYLLAQQLLGPGQRDHDVWIWNVSKYDK